MKEHLDKLRKPITPYVEKKSIKFLESNLSNVKQLKIHETLRHNLSKPPYHRLPIKIPTISSSTEFILRTQGKIRKRTRKIFICIATEPSKCKNLSRKVFQGDHYCASHYKTLINRQNINNNNVAESNQPARKKTKI